MSSHTRRALGVQAIHLIRETAEIMADIERAALRAKVEAASVRPTPGTLDTLATPVSGKLPGIGDSPKTVDVHDLVGLLPVQLRGRLQGQGPHKVEGWEDVFKAKGSL